ncbi:MAG: tyrosine-type recombinase/integrase [Anaerolineae bacterium]|jgi:integrase|nr:site-specific integrase [Chloroflexota bacterium]
MAEQSGSPHSGNGMSEITTVNDAAERMLADLDLSDLTKETYRHGLNALVRYLHLQSGDDAAADELAPCPLTCIQEETLYGLDRWLREAYPDPRQPARVAASESTRTSRTYLVAARRLMNWLDLHDLLPTGISYDRMRRRIDQGRGQRRQSYRRRRTDPQATRVLTHYLRQPLPEKKGPRRLGLLRNRALMATLYDTGMRISEALALTREDVLDGRLDRLRLTITKNGKPRTVFLSDESRRLIRAYVAEREDSPYAPLFVSHGRDAGKAITAAHAWHLVKQAARAEGLFENTSPHSLRHRRAQDLLDEGMPLEWVATLLGHEHPDTTRIVYAFETDERMLGDMVATYGKRPSEATGSPAPAASYDASGAEEDDAERQ